ncbi:hypothetical protein S7711_11301 [Stachybotrys chartarum IBT 7711]|uniref:Uncharacterized protein n=1 Tax=Stachybotrys chartarum (strain CBS 109288 / IBT 7711) TaxID=1280523 RepID=A0A084AF76_STACB|nr:hypothetical protein S7711_11301 [Stachybotrys chartarum IBT 7711]
MSSIDHSFATEELASFRNGGYYKDLAQAFVNIYRARFATLASKYKVDPEHCLIMPLVPRVTVTGCFCRGDPTHAGGHSWRCCPSKGNMVIGKDACLVSCPYQNPLLDVPHPATDACFNPTSKAQKFLAWLTEYRLSWVYQSINEPISYELFKLMHPYYAVQGGIEPKTHSQYSSHFHERFLMLLVGELRRPWVSQLPSNSNWRSTEMIHGVLNWVQRSQEECVESLVTEMIACKTRRLKKKESVSHAEAMELVTNVSYALPHVVQQSWGIAMSQAVDEKGEHIKSTRHKDVWK